MANHNSTQLSSAQVNSPQDPPFDKPPNRPTNHSPPLFFSVVLFNEIKLINLRHRQTVHHPHPFDPQPLEGGPAPLLAQRPALLVGHEDEVVLQAGRALGNGVALGLGGGGGFGGDDEGFFDAEDGVG